MDSLKVSIIIIVIVIRLTASQLIDTSNFILKIDLVTKNRGQKSVLKDLIYPKLFAFSCILAIDFSLNLFLETKLISSCHFNRRIPN